jgi:hypothetical protein
MLALLGVEVAAGGREGRFAPADRMYVKSVHPGWEPVEPYMNEDTVRRPRKLGRAGIAPVGIFQRR